jgi:drug/metabolite transporter (DMT)-like permease
MILSSYLSEISALLASICFSIGPTLNTLAGQRLSIATVNRVRLMAALGLLIIPHWVTQGVPFPTNGLPVNWIFMGLSGLFSLVLGDTLLFAAFKTIGTRLTMLIASLIPVFSALLAWFLLAERLTVMQTAGIGVTLTGVAWVVLDRQNGSGLTRDRRVYFRGFMLAFGAAFFHAIGYIASKKGLSGDFPAISAHMIRTIISLGIIMLPMLARRQTRSMVQELRQQPGAMKFILWGAFFGPLLGMWLALYAIQTINVGIATSLTALPPIWLLPVGRYFFKEKIGVRAIFGSLLAIMGVILMFLF